MARKIVALVGLALVGVGLLALGAWWRPERSPTAWTQGNLLPNADWSLPNDDSRSPDGWRISDGVERATTTTGYVLEGQHSLRLLGENSVARSPQIKATPGQRFRLGFQALVDPGQQSGQNPTRLQVWVHWIDAAGDDVRLDKQLPASIGYAADGEPTWTAVLFETEPAPANADAVAISLHPLAADLLFIDQLQFNAAGVYVESWPNGADAAVSFSVDWETAMGGYLHSLSGDPTTVISDATTSGLNARVGTTNLLALYREAGIRGTWFGNGYNFLNGNRERRTWMGDPTFAWANLDRRWRTDWSTRRWFGDDPYGTVESHPAWYFGDLLAPLVAADQPIETHTFSHMYVGFSTLAEWQADLAAWRSVAAEQRVAPAEALAFPFGGSDGMSDAHWRVLAASGISTVTRTRKPNDLAQTDDQYLLIDRNRSQPRLLPGRDVLALPDVQLLPADRAAVLQRLDHTIAAGGMLDIWAHTNEIVQPAQIAAWREVIARAAHTSAVWVAPIPEIAAYWRGIRQIEIEMLDAGSPLRFRITNPSNHDLRGVTLRLPGTATRVDSALTITLNEDRLRLDVPANRAEEITVWLEP